MRNPERCRMVVQKAALIVETNVSGKGAERLIIPHGKY